MHIRPRNEASGHITSRIPPLPPNKTVVQVLADFLVYLYKCARNYIQETHANGKDLWESVEKDIDFVISHPNGWEGWQQTQMREAVVAAGFVPDTDEGHARVSFVTEGEASLHFSIRNGLPEGAMEVCESFSYSKHIVSYAHWMFVEGGWCCDCGCWWRNDRHQHIQQTGEYCQRRAKL